MSPRPHVGPWLSVAAVAGVDSPWGGWGCPVWAEGKGVWKDGHCPHSVTKGAFVLRRWLLSIIGSSEPCWCLAQ